MNRPLIDLSIDSEGIAILTMQRPPVNSMNYDLLLDISQAIDEVADKQLKGLIFTSDSTKIFSAGLDLKEIHKPDPDRVRNTWKTVQEIAKKLMTSSFVSAVAIPGHTAAGGCLLSMCTDYRVMVNGKFAIGLNDSVVGIVPPLWIVLLMSHVMSPRNAELALTGSKMFTPTEALKAGLIDEVASDKTDAIAKCKQYIQSVQDVPPKVRAITKQRAKAIPLQRLQENQQEDLEEFVKMIVHPETQQIMDAYVKRLKEKKTAKL